MTALAVPHDLEDAVYAATRAAIGNAALATGPLVRSIQDRSERYTTDRARLSAPADKVGDLAARAAFFTVADAMKIAIPIGELATRRGRAVTIATRTDDATGARIGEADLIVMGTLLNELADPARLAIIQR